MDLPQPDTEQQRHSLNLQEHIRQQIQQAGGWIPFSRYMELCLYAPGLGYYSAGLCKFGPQGDFVTAPELGSLFARTLARCFNRHLEHLNGGDILELGGGSGQLAADVLLQLERDGRLPERWLMLERSADLRRRQQEALQAAVPHLMDRIHWLDVLPENLPAGVVYGNEVLDAMPVEILQLRSDDVHQLGVTAEASLRLQWQQAPETLSECFRQRLPDECQPGYISELCPGLDAWMDAIGGIFQRGYWLFSDYGYRRTAYYHPQRRRGSLQCHYRHRAHDDPLFWPGLQDITAHVDFDAVAEAMHKAGLSVDFIQYQSHFLLEHGLTNLAEASLTEGDSLEKSIRIANEIKRLTLPGEMGERFMFIQASRM